MADSTWEQRDLPILEAIAQLEGRRPSAADVAEAAGISFELTSQSLVSLLEAGYVAAGVNKGAWQSGQRFIRDLRLLERGKRATGVWPSDESQALMAALNRLIAAESDETKRGRLARLRDSLQDISNDVIAGLILAAGEIALRR